jgi:hypothetical protein
MGDVVQVETWVASSGKNGMMTLSAVEINCFFSSLLFFVFAVIGLLMVCND